jgi:hypothetical protein
VLQLLHTALTRNAYINVHLNDGAGLSIVAQGNIGSNVGVQKQNIQCDCQWNYILFLMKGLQTLAIQTLRLKGEVHIL